MVDDREEVVITRAGHEPVVIVSLEVTRRGVGIGECRSVTIASVALPP